MIEREQNDNCLGRDTRMCGDPESWFPMRVTYSRELKVKAELDRLEIENFLPMTYKLVDADTENPRRELVPAINNLIFVRSSKSRITSLKSANTVLLPLRYLMDRTAGQEHTIMTVPDVQMHNFMRVASRTDDSVLFLNDETVVGKEGKRVLITGGVFDEIGRASCRERV